MQRVPLLLQFRQRGPESVAARFSHPVLRDVIGRGAARANDDAFAAIAVDLSADLESEAVWRA